MVALLNLVGAGPSIWLIAEINAQCRGLLLADLSQSSEAVSVYLPRKAETRSAAAEAAFDVTDELAWRRSDRHKRGLWNLRRCRCIDPAIVRPRRRTPVKRGANIKSRILNSLIALVLAASRRASRQRRQRRAFRVVRHLWTWAIVRPLRLVGVLLVLYAAVGWYVLPPADVPADPVRIRLWLLVSGIVALIVDEVRERITREAREAREAMDQQRRKGEQKPK